MAYVVKIPKLGLTMTEGTVFKWHIKEGDRVKEGDLLFELATDKLVNEVLAEEDGVLRKVILGDGETAAVGASVAIIAKADEDISGLMKGAGETLRDNTTEETPQKAEEKITEKPAKSTGYVLATPAAKKLAKENGVDLQLVVGTGENGIILEKNVREYIENSKTSVKASPMAKKLANDLGVDLKSLEKDGRIMKEDVLKASFTPSTAMTPPTRLRKIIAQRMLESWQTTAAVTYNMEVDMTELKALREKLNKHYAPKAIKFSYNHLLIKALTKALMENPELNAYFDGENIMYHDHVNMGIAIAIGKELIVPNLKDADKKTLEEIAIETENLIKAAREGGLGTDDLTGGTFTITNLGSFGMDSFSPIVNKPESAILGINTIKDKPVVVEGQIVIRAMTNINLTADHRLIDGATSAVFLSRVKELIENPCLILV